MAREYGSSVETSVTPEAVWRVVEVGGPLGPAMGGMLGPQVSKDFPTLLENLARTAEKA
ncbi:MAG TPA: hypothetical protein VFL27_07440 [Candidatus Dormibacteraeota bacterium]|nr:hypothetical protein [Candidatus Dormibacteraeota bacterium]